MANTPRIEAIGNTEAVVLIVSVPIWPGVHPINLMIIKGI